MEMDPTGTEKEFTQSSLEHHHLARQWIEDALQVRIPSSQFDSYLRDGIYLCKLINRIWPAFRLAPNYGENIPAWRQNIEQFLYAAEELGLECRQLFRVSDLIESTNMDAVTSTVLALSDISLKKAGIINERGVSLQSNEPHALDGITSVSESFRIYNPSPSPQEDQQTCERSDGRSPVSSVDSGYAKSQHNTNNLPVDQLPLVPLPAPEETTIGRNAGRSSPSSRLGKFGSLSFARRFSSSRHKVPFHVRYQEWIDSKEEGGNNHELNFSTHPIRSASSPLIPYNRAEETEDVRSQQYFATQKKQLSTGTVIPSAITPVKNVSRSNNFRRKSLGMVMFDEPADGRKYLDLACPEGTFKTRYKLGDAIGRGHFGTVYRALDLMTGETVAIKRIKVESMEQKKIDNAKLEAGLLQTLNHPNIVQYVGLIHTSDSICIVLEYVENGSLSKTLKTFESFPEHLVADYCIQILQGLVYLHDRHVVHCDLKAANILTTKLGDVKLSDFGVSLNLHLKQHATGSVAGTPNWMAPEVISLQGASTKSDIWSLGCTIVELYTGKPPYAGIEPFSVMYRVVQEECPPLPSTLSSELNDFLRLCFRKDPDDRPSAAELLLHPWITGNSTCEAGERPVTPDGAMNGTNQVMMVAFPVSTPYSPVFDSDDEGPLSSTPRQQRHIISRCDQADEDQKVGTSLEGIHRLGKVEIPRNGNDVYCKICHTRIDQRMLECEACDIICHEDCAPGTLSSHTQQTNDQQSGAKFISSQKWLQQTRRLSRVFSTKSRSREHDTYR